MNGAQREVRAARLSDRPALGELSRRVHASAEGHRRSLGVPAQGVSTPRISLGTLIPSWLPLRPTSVHLVAEADGMLVGSARAIGEPHRDEWVIIELDAMDLPMAAEIRWGLLQALVAEAVQHGVARIHAACADVPENMTLFGQLDFTAYAEEEIWYRAPGAARNPNRRERKIGPKPRRPGDAGPVAGEQLPLRPVGAADAWHLFDLWAHTTPPAIARLEGYGAVDWEPVGHEGVVPRSALNPLLHFNSVGAWLQPEGERASGFAQHGACREGPHYLRFLLRDGLDGPAFLRAVLDSMGAEAAAAGILSPVRTYEATGLQAASDSGFEPIGSVTILVREVQAAVRQPALVPAI